MTEAVSTLGTVGPDRRITHCLGFIVALYASWHPNIALVVGAFLVNGLIAWGIPYQISKGFSKAKPFKGWLYLCLTIIGSIVAIGGKLAAAS